LHWITCSKKGYFKFKYEFYFSQAIAQKIYICPLANPINQGPLGFVSAIVFLEIFIACLAYPDRTTHTLSANKHPEFPAMENPTEKPLMCVLVWGALFLIRKVCLSTEASVRQTAMGKLL